MIDIIKILKRVVFPFSNYFESLDVVINTMNKEDLLLHRAYMLELSLALLLKPQKADELLINASKAHNTLNIDKNIMRKLLSIYFKLMLLFTKNTDYYENLEKNINHYNELFMNAYKIEEDFFVFDNEEVDEVINTMHFDKKISAKEFLDYEEIDSEELNELGELFREYENIKDFENDKYFEIVEHILKDFVRIFLMSVEFKNLAYSLEKLLNLKINENNKKTYKIFLDTVIEDLYKFYKNIFIEQSAIDIHYLDASLLSNIEQIQLMIGVENEDN